MYDIEDVVTGIKNPRRALLELNRVYHRKIRGKTGIKVMEEDWDNLIILDACRYDLFEEVNSIDGELTSVISGDSSTSGFLKHNFGDEYFADTVYVSANPQVQRHEVGRRFHDCIRLWETEWDNKLNTVPPENVTNAAIKVQQKYPNKRLIIHYIQPHYPFIGELGQTIEQGSITGDGVVKKDRSIGSIWDQLEAGDVEKNLVLKAYKENLEIAFPEVERLIDNLTGKSIVTSDHGNELGKYNIYGHPGGVFLDSLVRVPWLTINTKTRKSTRDGEISNNSYDTKVKDTVNERLEDLGYLE